MTALQMWIHTPGATAIGAALGHFVWEGAAIAALLSVALWMARDSSARVRYALACAALVAMPVAFGLTLAVYFPHPTNRAMVAPAMPEIPSVEFGVVRVTSAPLRLADVVAWAAPLWIAGVLCLFVYRLASWIAVLRLRQLGTCAVPEEWSSKLEAIRARVGISRAVTLLESALAEVPMVIGYLRPVILIPMGMLAGLPMDQVEAVILHELAHIRRADYLVNLLQSALESLLFYHPAVWWISSVVRAERENCCDDFVIARETDPRTYAAALLALEQGRSSKLALAASGGNLLGRVRRMLQKSETHHAIGPAAPITLAILGAGIALAAWQPDLVKPLHTAAPGRVTPAPQVAKPPKVLIAQAPQTGQTSSPRRDSSSVPLPYSQWLNEDVAYIITNAERAAWTKLSTDPEREQFIRDFWDRRNPVPGSATNQFKDEHYRRIAYANARFNFADHAGWTTDRGRIYITYGPPDEMEAHPAGGPYTRPAEQGGGTTSTFPFQKWRYRFIEGLGNNIIIEFVDSSMNGEFRMTTDPMLKDARLYAPISPNFPERHVAVAVRPTGQVTLMIPLDGTGPFHIYAKTETTAGRPINYFEETDNPPHTNLIRSMILKPGSYLLTAHVNGYTEVVNFEVK